MNTQTKKTFPDGGFVIHGITGLCNAGRISAWFALNGELLDAEQLFRNVPYTMPIRKGGPIWRQLERIGRVNAEPIH